MSQKQHYLFIFCYFWGISLIGQAIPLAEHPRPDFERKAWENLNGEWNFAFDSLNIGIQENWLTTPTNFNKKSSFLFHGVLSR